MYSFYGGRPGNPFIIITTYETIGEMIENFKLGPGYVEVHYDEHVMINNTNRNDPNNGKIFRRGYDFTNDMGGAEYIGTIIGPAGMAPMLEMGTVSDINGKSIIQGYTERKSSGNYTVSNASLVPGKVSDSIFNDSISWSCYSMRDAAGNDTTAYIGFVFPYPVIEFETRAVDPYVNNRYTDTSAATRADDRTHPFYQKWRISVPKGVKGTSLKNLRVITANASVADYEGKLEDISNNKQILVCDSYSYDNSQTGNAVTEYVADYNIINDVELKDNGTLVIKCSHADDVILNKAVKWPAQLSINSESNGRGEGTGNQKVHITWNDGTSQDIGSPINYIMAMAVDGNNRLLVKYSDPAKRTNSLTFNGTSGWTSIGQITQAYEYGEGSSATGLFWSGKGQVTNGSVLHFVITPAIVINSIIDDIEITQGSLTIFTQGTPQTINDLDEAGISITKTITGLDFQVPVSGISNGFVDLVISNLGLKFGSTEGAIAENE